MLLAEYSQDGGVQLFGFKPERAGSALIGYAPLAIDQVHAIGPRGVCLLGGITELIENSRKFYSELTHAGSGHQCAFIFIPGTGEHDFVPNVAFHLPHVTGVGLEDIDDKKRDLASILVIELIEGRNLPPERRSSIATEDEYDRLVRSQRRQSDSVRLVKLHQCEVWSEIADA